MKIVCAWCEHEGLPSRLGEKAPFGDARETHGLCPKHLAAVKADWAAKSLLGESWWRGRSMGDDLLEAVRKTLKRMGRLLDLA